MVPLFQYQHRVRPDEIDEHGHVNNVNYLRWMQSAAVRHSSEVGWPPERYQREQLGWVARKHVIEYLVPAFEGDQIVVRTWVADFRKVTSLRRYRMVRTSDGAV